MLARNPKISQFYVSQASWTGHEGEVCPHQESGQGSLAVPTGFPGARPRRPRGGEAPTPRGALAGRTDATEPSGRPPDPRHASLGSRSRGGGHGPARPSSPRPTVAGAAASFSPAPRDRYLLGAGGCSMAVGGRRRDLGGGEGRREKRSRARGTTQGNSRNSGPTFP